MKLIARVATALAAVAALALLGCPPTEENGDELPDIEELFPADNEVGSWVEDTSTGAAGVEVARSYTETWEMVDGDADSFEDGLVAFAREYYTDGSMQLQLRVWEMKDADTCSSIYSSLVSDDPLYSANTWEDVSLGEAGRVADTGTHWWFNSRSKIFQVEAWIDSNDDPGKSAAQSFLEAVLEKI
jgi:hypothetical protein